MDKTCKTCSWWKKGYCEFVDTIKAGNEDTRFEIVVRVSDDTGLDCKLATGPNFGCIHHEVT